jgi:signal transduction histidine kinase
MLPVTGPEDEAEAQSRFSASNYEIEAAALQLAQQLKESQTLYQISQTLAGALDLTATLQQIANAAYSLTLAANRAVVHLMEESGDFLVAVAVAGFTSPAMATPPSARMNFRPGEGIAGLALSLGKTIRVADVLTDPRYLHEPSQTGEENASLAGAPNSGNVPAIRALLVAPIITDNKSLGTLSIQSQKPNAFTAQDEHLASILGAQAAVAIEKAQMLRKEREQREQAEMLYDVSRVISQSLDLKDLLDQVLSTLQSRFDFYSTAIYLVEIESSGEPVLRLARSSLAGEIAAALPEQLKPGEELANRAALARQAILEEKPDQEETVKFALPLLKGATSTQLFGVLIVGRQAPANFSHDEERMMRTVAEQLSAAIEKAQLYSSLEESLQHEKAARAQLVQSEKLAALGRIVASVAHELNNPLQAIQNALYLIKLEESLSPQAREDLQTVLNETVRMSDLITRLRETYRPALREEFQVSSLNNLVVEVQKLLATHLRHHHIAFEFKPYKNLPPISMIRDQIKQVILNICLNAVEAMEQGGELRVATKASTDDNGIVISISDNGPSISPNVLPYIFDPFVTTKEGGTGLGLAITYDIVRRHNGHIDVETAPHGGATFHVWLPVEQDFNTGKQSEA